MSIADIFKAAWFDICLPSYKRGEINNECTLHAMLYAELRDKLPRQKYLVLCEPQLNGAIPDIVVLDTEDRTIVGIAELKLERYPPFERDLDKLARLAKCDLQFPLLLDPDAMVIRSDFAVSENCILVFAVIGANDSWAIHEDTLRSRMEKSGVAADRFLALIHSVGG